MASVRPEVRSLLVVEDSSTGVDRIVSRSKFRQHVAAILANLATLCIGMANAWTAPALPLIQRETDVMLPLFATSDQASWISSLLPIGAVVGALPAGCLADKLGRKKVLLMMAVPYFLGWVLIVLAADSVTQVYVGRFVIGLAMGACTVLVPLYNEEIAEDSIRGSLGVYFDFILCVGILVMYILGTLLSYAWFTTICAIVPLIFAATFCCMPESPTYLVSQGLVEEAEKALLWLRNSSILCSTDVSSEINRLIVRCKEAESLDKPPLFNRTAVKATAIVFGLMFFQQWSAVNAFVYYAVQIFDEAGSPFPPTNSSILIGVVMVIGIFIPTFTVDKLGRRPLLMISSIGACLCLATLSGYFYYKLNGYDVDSWTWLPLAALIVYFVALSTGFGPLPFFMVAELVPTSDKGKISAVAISFNRAMTFLVTKLFPVMLHFLGQDVTYGFFSVICLGAALFVALAVPETKGRSREEIQLLLEGNILF